MKKQKSPTNWPTDSRARDLLFLGTGVTTLIEQIQLVIRLWHGCLQGNVLKEAWKADFLEKAEAQNL